MNQFEFTEIVAQANGLSRKQARRVVRTVLRTLQETVIRGDRVVFSGFGVFDAVEGKARKGHNPQSNQLIEIEAKRRPRFTPGATFKKAVQTGELPEDDIQE